MGTLDPANQSATPDPSCRSDLYASNTGSEPIAALQPGFGVACRTDGMHGAKLAKGMSTSLCLSYQEAPPKVTIRREFELPCSVTSLFVISETANRPARFHICASLSSGCKQTCGQGAPVKAHGRNNSLAISKLGSCPTDDTLFKGHQLESRGLFGAPAHSHHPVQIYQRASEATKCHKCIGVSEVLNTFLVILLFSLIYKSCGSPLNASTRLSHLHNLETTLPVPSPCLHQKMVFSELVLIELKGA